MSASGASVVVAHTAQKTANGSRPRDRDAAAKGCGDQTARGDDYVAVEDEGGSLIGFFHYKQPQGPRLEIGLGLHPEWTGQGLGKSFLEAGLEYARRRFAPKQFTLSVASFNRRAITV